MISPRFSYHLDLLRFVAAFVVLLSHYAYPRFTQGDFSFIIDYNLGSDAVVVFFVLSGFVISFAGVEKDKTAKRFAFSRLTRLYSVAIPALLLTLICDKIGLLMDPNIYKHPYYVAQPMGEFWLRGLTFSTEWTGQAARLGSNGPFWSLSYEAAYYLLFAILMFSRGALRLISLAVVILVVGLKVMLLLPAWAMGAGLYFLMQRLKNYNPSPVLLGLMMGVPLFLYVYFLLIDGPRFLYIVSLMFVPADRMAQLNFSSEFLRYAFIGILFSVHFLGAALWLQKTSDRPRSNRLIKWLAGASFSLYLVHYPVLSVTKALLPNTENVALNHSLLLAITMVVCFIFAEFFERPLYKYRRWIENLPKTLKRELKT